MKKVKRIIPFLMIAVLSCVMSITALASDEIPNLNKRGTITVKVQDTKTKQPVSGGSLKIYQVALAAVDDGDFSFEYTDAFSGCEWALNDSGVEIYSKELADNLAGYIAGQEESGKKIPVRESARIGAEESGAAVFRDNLELGLYLVMQDASADGYSSLNPFLVTIPLEDDGKLYYDVDASPKAGTVEKIPDSGKPEKVPQSKLPQTGMLWWPVPIFAGSGLLLFLVGWIRRQRSGELR